MNITIIGSGNVATVLAKLFIRCGHSINEVAGRNETAVNFLAETVKAKPCFNLKELNKDSDVFLIAVKDDAVAEVAAQFNVNTKFIVHTCGSVSLNVLNKSSENYGVLYPLQSLRKELKYDPVIPFLIDGNNEQTKEVLQQFATSLSKTILHANDEQRLQYHLSATIVSNFTNHLFALTKDYCDKHNADFRLLLPLTEETVNRMHYYDPAVMQTGPAARGDKRTIEKHLALLENNSALKNIYELMSESIQSKNINK